MGERTHTYTLSLMMPSDLWPPPPCPGEEVLPRSERLILHSVCEVGPGPRASTFPFTVKNSGTDKLAHIQRSKQHDDEEDSSQSLGLIIIPSRSRSAAKDNVNNCRRARA